MAGTGSPSRRRTLPRGNDRSRVCSAITASSWVGRPAIAGSRRRARIRPIGAATVAGLDMGQCLLGKAAEGPLYDPGHEEAGLDPVQRLEARAECSESQLSHVVGGQRPEALARLVEERRQQRVVVEAGGGGLTRGLRLAKPLLVRRVVDQGQDRPPERRCQQVLDQLPAAGPYLGVRVAEAPMDVPEVLVAE